jgi:hypothetical protein
MANYDWMEQTGPGSRTSAYTKAPKKKKKVKALNRANQMDQGMALSRMRNKTYAK